MSTVKISPRLPWFLAVHQTSLGLSRRQILLLLESELSDKVVFYVNEEENYVEVTSPNLHSYDKYIYIFIYVFGNIFELCQWNGMTFS